MNTAQVRKIVLDILARRNLGPGPLSRHENEMLSRKGTAAMLEARKKDPRVVGAQQLLSRMQAAGRITKNLKGL